jgi:hypothetical protein
MDRALPLLEGISAAASQGQLETARHAVLAAAHRLPLSDLAHLAASLDVRQMQLFTGKPVNLEETP